MKYVFGPVPSRRLGRSLGIDPVPFKTCNWNCVYCQLGRTTPMTNVRREFFPRFEIVAEVADTLAGPAAGEIDWITFVGSGEPLLHAGLGAMIREVKSLTPLPVAVITNGSLLYQRKIQEELMAADAVLPTLDVGSAKLYQTINRPLPQLRFESLVEGLSAFRRGYRGKMWLEVMLVRGINDTEEALADLAGVLVRIQPDEVQINVPVRPPAEPWVEAPDEERLARAREVLGGAVRTLGPDEERFDLANYSEVDDAIVEVVTRHPMREQQLLRTLANWNREQITEALERLAAAGRLQRISRAGTVFWTTAQARYGERR